MQRVDQINACEFEIELEVPELVALQRRASSLQVGTTSLLKLSLEGIFLHMAKLESINLGDILQDLYPPEKPLDEVKR